MNWQTKTNDNGLEWYEAYVHPNPSDLDDRSRCYIFVQVVPTPAGQWYWHSRGWRGAHRGDASGPEEAKRDATEKLRALVEEAHAAPDPMNWNNPEQLQSGVFSQTGTAMMDYLQVHITNAPGGYFLDMRGWADAMTWTASTPEEARSVATAEFKTLINQLRTQI